VLDAEWTHVVSGPESWEACFVRDGLTLSISASDTDPWVNVAPPVTGLRQLFLWATCLDRGVTALEADAAGSLDPLGFQGLNGCANLGGGRNLLLSIPGCPIGAEANLLLGSWWVYDQGGDLCLAPSEANGALVFVECPAAPPRLATPGVVGFSSVGEPCHLGLACGQTVADVGAPTVPGIVSRTAPDRLALAVRGTPFRDRVELSLAIPADGPASLRVFDVAGRLVRTLVSGPLGRGTYVSTWEGRGDAGERVPAGVYFARLVTGAGDGRVVKVVRVR